ncbi:MAG: hypothetical protein NTY74_13165 [Ignavibacteriae bacterium]|nr:hypothetical protein [Ignavibacteriota bacterium]
MSKKLLLISALITLLFISQLSYAQEMEDIVYLKNGSVIRGTIIEQVLNETIKIKTRDENVFVYKYDEILKIAKEESSYSKNSTGSRYIGTLSGGVTIQIPSKSWGDEGVGFNVNLSNGLLFNNNFGMRLNLRYNGFKGLNDGNVTAGVMVGDFGKYKRLKTYGLIDLGVDYLNASGYSKVYLGIDIGGGINYELSPKSGLYLNVETKYHHNTNSGTAKGFVPINIGITYIK